MSAYPVVGGGAVVYVSGPVVAAVALGLMMVVAWFVLRLRK